MVLAICYVDVLICLSFQIVGCVLLFLFVRHFFRDYRPSVIITYTFTVPLTAAFFAVTTVHPSVTCQSRVVWRPQGLWSAFNVPA